MEKVTMTGLALAVGGAIGILSLELIGTAYANRDNARDYLVAIGVGAPVKLVPMAPTLVSHQGTLEPKRTLVCRGGVLGFGALSVGHRCSR